MKKVVSVSLGARSGDMAVETAFAGVSFSIERQGTDGDIRDATRRIGELDGTVDAIGLGGIDRYLIAGGRRYEMKDAARMASAAHTTPVVDGSGLKHTLERETVLRLQDSGEFDFRGKKVLLVCAVDRFGMAEALVGVGADVIFGDLIYALGIPIPVRSLRALGSLARIVLPVQSRLPIHWVYPTGSKQESFQCRSPRYYEWADIIAGDFHLIRRYLPEGLNNKVLLTNTVRTRHLGILRERGVRQLITTTPEFGGQSFGTNVMEGVVVALLGKRPEAISAVEYTTALSRLGWQPRNSSLC